MPAAVIVYVHWKATASVSSVMVPAGEVAAAVPAAVNDPNFRRRDGGGYQVGGYQVSRYLVSGYQAR